MGDQEGSMKGVNRYWVQLTAEEIASGKHRGYVGGFWDEIGMLQFEFLRSRGLGPGDRLLDVGCGAMRGGLHFIRFLEPGNYFGLDINESLISAGGAELAQAGLDDRRPSLLVDDRFRASRFGVKFDFALAVSLFTHLFGNHIVRCLVEVGKVLKSDGEFYATFFEAPFPGHLEPLDHSPGGIVSHYDFDPFHYSFVELRNLAGIAGLTADYIGSWDHPRDQKMAVFRKAP